MNNIVSGGGRSDGVLLYHLYEYGESNENEESFKEHPKACFIVDEYKVDIDIGWKEGFVNSTGLEHKRDL